LKKVAINSPVSGSPDLLKKSLQEHFRY